MKEGRRLQSPQQHVEQLRHQRTLRGHRFAVYCITFDRSDRYVITGSDDHLVKVSCMQARLMSRNVYCIPIQSDLGLLRAAALACSACQAPADLVEQSSRLPPKPRGGGSAYFCLVQIWSIEAALLIACCRGHDGEVTDLATNADNTIVASSSNDATIRCWSLKVSLPHRSCSCGDGSEAHVALGLVRQHHGTGLLNASFILRACSVLYEVGKQAIAARLQRSTAWVPRMELVRGQCADLCTVHWIVFRWICCGGCLLPLSWMHSLNVSCVLLLRRERRATRSRCCWGMQRLSLSSASARLRRAPCCPSPWTPPAASGTPRPAGQPCTCCGHLRCSVRNLIPTLSA